MKKIISLILVLLLFVLTSCSGSEESKGGAYNTHSDFLWSLNDEGLVFVGSESGLYFLDIKGRELIRIPNTKDGEDNPINYGNINSPYLINDRLFYFKHEEQNGEVGLYSIKRDGTDIKKHIDLAESKRFISFSDTAFINGKFYFVLFKDSIKTEEEREHFLYTYKIDSGELVKITGDEDKYNNIEIVSIEKDGIIYSISFIDDEKGDNKEFNLTYEGNKVSFYRLNDESKTGEKIYSEVSIKPVFSKFGKGFYYQKGNSLFNWEDSKTELIKEFDKSFKVEMSIVLDDLLSYQSNKDKSGFKGYIYDLKDNKDIDVDGDVILVDGRKGTYQVSTNNIFCGLISKEDFLSNRMGKIKTGKDN